MQNCRNCKKYFNMILNYCDNFIFEVRLPILQKGRSTGGSSGRSVAALRKPNESGGLGAAVSLKWSFAATDCFDCYESPPFSLNQAFSVSLGQHPLASFSPYLLGTWKRRRLPCHSMLTPLWKKSERKEKNIGRERILLTSDPLFAATASTALPLDQLARAA